MKTNVIPIRSDLAGKDKALREAEKFAEYNDLTGKNAMHLRLLTEETLSMVHGIVSDFQGKLWFESLDMPDGLLCRICVSANKDVDMKQEEQLLSVSTSGKNVRAKGIMGKIREMFRVSMQCSADGTYSGSAMQDSWYKMGTHYDPMSYNSVMADSYWSLQRYRENIQSDEESEEEWDELEKSIVGKLADEVKVGLLSGLAEVIIEKKFVK